MSSTANQFRKHSPGTLPDGKNAPDSVEDVWQHFMVEFKKSQEVKGFVDGDVFGDAAQLLLPQIQQNLLKIPAYQKLVDEAHKVEAANGLWVANDIYQDKDVHVSLVTVFRDQPLPFHDHPDVSGMLIILSGETRVIHCNVTAISDDAQTTELSVVVDCVLGTGQVGSFSENYGNIHGLEPQSDRCVILVAHLPPYSEKQQSFYFPMTAEIQENNSFSAMKLSVGKFRKLKTANG